MAMISGIYEAAVAEDEAQSLAKALLDICRRRKLKPNKELLAWGNFLVVAAGIYLPRLIAVLANRHAAREEKKRTSGKAVAAQTDAEGRVTVPQTVN